MKTWSERLWQFWFAPVDAIRWDSFRVVLGIVVLIYVAFRWQHAQEWLTLEGFHVPPEFLPYHALSVPLVPVELLPLFGIVLFGSLIAFILGWQLAWTSWLTLGCFLYVTFADQLSAFVTNKVSCVALLLLCVAPRGNYWRIGKKVSSTHLIPAWPTRVMQLQLIIHYFIAGWNKVVFGEWLMNPLVLWTQIQGTYLTDFGALLIRVLPFWVWIILQFQALAFEVFAPLHFGRKQLRKVGLVWGLGFQLVVAATMKHLIYFSLVMLSYYVVFMDEHLLRKIYFKFNPGNSASRQNCPQKKT